MAWKYLLISFSCAFGSAPLTPFYTGSLLSSDAITVSPKTVVVQGYANYLCQYGSYNSHYALQTSSSTKVYNPIILWQAGLNSWMDIEAIMQGFYKSQQGSSSLQWGDPSLIVGFQIYKNDSFPFYVRLTLSEIFPLGKFEKLDPYKKGTDQSSQGSYQSVLGLNWESTAFRQSLHPVRWRMNIAYTYLSPVKIEGLNAFGGNRNTKGKVSSTNALFFLFSPEIPFTQNWIFTFDFTYSHTFSRNFSGTSRDNLQLGSSDIFNLAPAIEYGFNPNLGIIAGCWFSLWGKNATAFAGGSISFVASW